MAREDSRERRRRFRWWTWGHRSTAIGFLALLFLGGREWFPWFSGSTSAATLFGWIPVTDPLAALEITLASRTFDGTVVLGAGILLLAALLLGPIFCGWVCPLGLIFDLNAGMRRRIARIARFRARSGPRLARWWRMVSLGGVLGFSSAAALPLFQTVSPINFVAWLVVFLPLPALIPEPGIWETLRCGVAEAVAVGGPLLAILGGLLLIELAVPRLWCRAICPLGGLYSLVGRSGRLRVTCRSQSDCLHVAELRRGHDRATVGVVCGRCTAECPMAIDVLSSHVEHGKKTVDDPDCTRCGACIDVCPTRALGFGVFGFRSRQHRSERKRKDPDESQPQRERESRIS